MAETTSNLSGNLPLSAPERGSGGEVSRARRLLGRLANPLAGKELLARMRGPRTFVVATLLLLPLAAVAGGLYAMIAAASASDVSSGTPVGKLFFAAVTAVEELTTYDETAPEEEDSAADTTLTQVKRRLVVALPRTLVAGKTAKVHVGFNPASGGQSLTEPSDMVLRLSVLNGEPSRPKEQSLQLADDAAQQTFDVTPGNYTKARIKVQVFQLGPNPDDIAVAGGLYVDADVVADAKGVDDRLTAYGTDVTVSG